MLVAHDKNGNRIYANSGIKYEECFCPECGEQLIHKMGEHNRPHFSHKPKSACSYGDDRDNKSPWHIHMQELFPKEALEVRFYDAKIGETHVADVFLKDSNTVIEFQHSHITDEEFLKRTEFHIREGRRIVWVFDESKEGSAFGKLKKADYPGEFDWPHMSRKALNAVREINDLYNLANYSICLYLGDEADCVHRIMREHVGFKYVTLSPCIALDSNMNPDVFFYPGKKLLHSCNSATIISNKDDVSQGTEAVVNSANSVEYKPRQYYRRRGRL